MRRPPQACWLWRNGSNRKTCQNNTGTDPHAEVDHEAALEASSRMKTASPHTIRNSPSRHRFAMHLRVRGRELFQQPLVLGRVMDLPGALRAGHHIEIIEIVAMSGGARVIAPGNESEVAVFYRHRLIERAVVGIDALKCKA